MAYVSIADRDHEIEHHDPQTFITKYIWSQDHKVIAVQYGITAIFVGVIALVLSAMMRLQLGFPDSFSFINPENYYQFVTMHGMIMVIYLLTALFLGGFGNYLIPLMCGSRDMVFPYMNMLSYWVYLLSVIILLISFFVEGGSTGAGWTLYPPQAIMPGTPGIDLGILLMLGSLGVFIVAFTMGGLNYVTTVLQARCRGMTLMRMPLSVWGIFMATVLGLLAFPALLVSAIMMILDKTIMTSFFMPAISSMGTDPGHTGGSPILFQHLFWFFGHRNRIRVHVHSRRAHGPVPRQRDDRPAAVGHLFCRGALPHGDGRIADPRRLRCHLSLVPEDYGQDVQRDAWQVAFLDDLPRHLRNLLADALPRFPGCAAPILRYG
jgi:cytochrome c oxidase subunit 1